MMQHDYDLQRAIEARDDERYEEAHDYLIQSVETARNRRDDEQLANVLLLLADNLSHYWPAGAIDLFVHRRAAAEEALNLFRKAGNRQGEARCLMKLAYVDAEFAKAALAIAREVDDQAIIVEALCYLANQAQPAEAKEMISEAVRVAEQVGDADLLASTLFDLGFAARHDIAAYERMATLEGQCRRKRAFVCRLAMAASLIDDLNPSLARDWYERGLAIARSLDDALLEGMVLSGMSQLEKAAGNVVKGEELAAISKVLCPVPDITPLVEAFERGGLGELTDVLKSLGIRAPGDGATDDAR